MVGFKNRYLLMEVFVDPNKDFSLDEPIIITQFNLSKAIKDSILTNFGECGLASSTNSFQVKYVNPITKICIFRTSREEYQKVWAAITMVRSIGNCPWFSTFLTLVEVSRPAKKAALKCDESKFEQYKLLAGERLPADAHQRMQNCVEKVKALEH
ncbi:UNVERIFIED_CONTAM: putative ribonuclease P/MRP protein subunit POP5 [Sesamum angustifolium]|uniref:Ribonuclease P/MRP protein subunit POP5 n=1 Tax=Sesamum angustifolium TaxID=2727405 RepID=A0AAW2LG23_9LAMI